MSLVASGDAFPCSGERQGAHLPSAGYTASAALPVSHDSAPTWTSRQLTASRGQSRRVPERWNQRPDRSVPDLHSWSPIRPFPAEPLREEETEDTLCREATLTALPSPEQGDHASAPRVRFLP